MERDNNEKTPMDHPEDDEQEVVEEGDLADTMEEMDIAEVDEAVGLAGEDGEEEELPDDSIQGFFAHKGAGTLPRTSIAPISIANHFA
jgi:hypothetical protein